MEDLKMIKSTINNMNKELENEKIKNNLIININVIIKDLMRVKSDIDFEEGEISKICDTLFMLRNKIGWK